MERQRYLFEIFRRLIHSRGTKEKEEKAKGRRCNFEQDDSSARVYPRATKRPQSLLLLPREIRRRNCERGSRLLLIEINKSWPPISSRVSLSVPDTSVRVQRGIVSQYERGAAQESGAGGDLVDGAGKQGRDFQIRLNLERGIFGNEKIAICVWILWIFFLFVE